MNLTEQELKAIESDALAYNCSPYGNPNPVTYGYIKGATIERIKAKKLLEALGELVELKNLKDRYGKTENYEVRQPNAWEKAKEAITEYNKNS